MQNEKILVATATFATQVGDTPVIVHKGITRVRASHPLVKANPDAFEEFDNGLHFEGIEEATSKPGARRGGRGRGKKDAPPQPEGSETPADGAGDTEA